jgi:type I restriction enzyme M protein
MSELQSKIDRITDILRRDDGISGAMHYTEQISWILFLKFLDDYERNKADEALLEGREYKWVIAPQHRWEWWACPREQGTGKRDLKRIRTGTDLLEYVNRELFEYLRAFKDGVGDARNIRYKIGAVFEYVANRIASGHTLREILDIVDTLNFQRRDDLFELSQVYENLLKGMGSDGGNSGEFYTPRAVVKAMVRALDPRVGQTVYDGAAGSCGFLVEAFEYMKQQPGLGSADWTQLQQDTFFGNEKTPLAYVMGVMNMILHGVESPNISKFNTLTTNIRDIQEGSRHHIILANPPFGGKEKDEIQGNFPIKSNATELLFLQHFMRTLKTGGKAAIVVPEGVLFQTGAAFSEVKRELLNHFNLHTILSLPAGVFLPYSGVKTNVIFFERTGATRDIWYYEVEPPYKLTKNKPILSEHLEEFLLFYPKRKASPKSWSVPASAMLDFDLSAKNPNKQQQKVHESPKKILGRLRENEVAVQNLLKEIETILEVGYEG